MTLVRYNRQHRASHQVNTHPMLHILANMQYMTSMGHADEHRHRMTGDGSERTSGAVHSGVPAWLLVDRNVPRRTRDSPKSQTW